MRFFRRLIQPGNEPSSTTAEIAEPVERRHPPVRCRGCGRPNPPYIFAENEHHYCVECARRSWKLMRLRPIARRREDKALARSVTEEDA